MSGTSRRPTPSGPVPPRRRVGAGVHPAVLTRRLARGARRRSRLHLAALAAAALAIATVLVWGGGQAALALLDDRLGAVPDSRRLPADSVVLDRHGQVIAVLHARGERRAPVALAQISPELRRATVAVEDRNFWHEGAVDGSRLVAAAWTDLVHGSPVQGASTITEQLAKVLYVGTSPRTVERKLREIFIARHLARTLSREQVLEEYLNDINYGHGAYGAEAAARTYFGVAAAQLDLAQAALLAGLPNSPALLDPFHHPDAARARQRAVLAAMVDTGAATAAAAAAAQAEPPALATGAMGDLDLFPTVTARAVREVRERLGLDAVTAGLRITTTVDSELQQFSQAAVTRQVDAMTAQHAGDGALVAVDPRSGEVLAHVGSAGPGHPAEQLDMAAQPRSPGSTFKLFTYAAALQARRLSMVTPIRDRPYSLPHGGGADGGGRYQVHDYDPWYRGTVTVKEALASSLNVPAVKAQMLTGIPEVVRVAQGMGVTTLGRPTSGYGASLTLGGYPVPLEELAQAATVFAAEGWFRAEHLLLSVSARHGGELLARRPGHRALDPGVAFVMNAILADDANRAPAFGSRSALTIPGHLVAAKTGTTTEFRDNLTVGWTPRLALATWVGNADDSPMRGTTGLSGAAPIWNAVMSHALGTAADGWPAPPPGVERVAGGWVLEGTSAETGAETGALQELAPQADCRQWNRDGGLLWACGPARSGLAGDPGPPASPSPSPGLPQKEGGPGFSVSVTLGR
ncbi:MAG TPA: transglycosylase domain-containing protein [Candidatus Dormibacteraeota bacterium]|nr:transglycosylase domain-containing protein [Candidatus Dormibacteraeota bacterium]